jgi:quercetin dioxygenase-like cupin family protein
MTASRSYLDEHPLRGREVVIDLDEVTDEVLPIPPDRDRKGVALLKHTGLNMVVTALRAGAELSEHTSRGVIAIQVLDGFVELRTNQTSDDIRTGQMAIIDVLEPHTLTAREDSLLLITVSMLQEMGADVSDRHAA